jgi:hypothetical protein
MEASRDLIVMPAARGHEYIRVGQNGIRAKLGIDATIPCSEKSALHGASSSRSRSIRMLCRPIRI